MLSRDLHLDVKTVEGHYGELSVLVDGEMLISAGPLGFIGVLPTVRKVREMVKAKMALATTSRSATVKGV